MNYVCRTVDDVSSAVIMSDAGKELDAKACETKYAAMQLRDRARNAEVMAFAHLDNPPPVVESEAFAKFDGDGDGNPGGSRPKKPKPTKASK